MPAGEHRPDVLSKIGTLGGKATLKKRGRKHFSKISRMRKSFSGGRPRGSARPPGEPNAPLKTQKR